MKNEAFEMSLVTSSPTEVAGDVAAARQSAALQIKTAALCRGAATQIWIDRNWKTETFTEPKMKTLKLLPLLTISILLALRAGATTFYVDVNSASPTPPYADWSTASTDIQSAIDASVASDQILVTNGIYQTGGRVVYGAMTNRVVVNKAVVVQSVNGPAVTIIQGYPIAGDNAVRCAYLTNGALLSGFTLTTGATRKSGDIYKERSGAGIWCESASGVVSNCVLATNNAYSYGGGAFGGTLNNCVVSKNSAGSGAGTSSNTVNNSLLAGNSALSQGGGAFRSTLNNCTVVTNAASDGGGVSGGTLNNCIVYYNSTGGLPGPILSPNYSPDSTVNFCCTTPLPLSGIGNFTNTSLFVDFAGRDYHLQFSSPCVNAGNNDYVSSPNDLDGKPRIAGGIVDIGAYEYELVSQTNYVNVSCTTPVYPYGSWTTAATNIQDAIDAAQAGYTVLVTNGVYSTGGKAMAGNLTNRVTLDKPITLLSVGGAEVTFIQGQWDPAVTNGPLAVRCAWLTNWAAISGFTLCNGATRSDANNLLSSGGGVWCASASALIIDCTLSNNSAAYQGGGVLGGRLMNCTLQANRAVSEGGGACSNLLEQCLLIENLANGGAGAIYATLNSCKLIKNQGGHQGGGAQSSTLNNCLVVSNTANAGAGVIWSTLSNCVLSANSANNGGGAYGSTIINSIITTNFAVDSGAGASGGTFKNCLFLGNQGARGGGVWPGVLTNCTLVGNYASQTGGGARGATLYNCILWGNSSPVGANYYIDVTLRYTCSSPLAAGAGNISSTPLFADALTRNYRPQSNSPCINAGNNTYVASATDLDGNPRISGSTVDIGAYELQSPASVLSYAWAQQNELPTDGSADYLDSDGDGLNNWQEWMSGTVPTNAASVLQVSAPSNSVTGLTVTWQSVNTRTYYLQSSTNLTAFTSLQSNIVGKVGTTSYTDTTATNGGPYFYRVGVQ
jgi:hypothetical protein